MILNTSTLGAGISTGGPPVLLLHGLFGAGKNLGQIARGLARHATVVSLDLRNHGDSPHAAAMDYPTLAADVVATMAALDIPRAALVGHSMGGKTAMTVALLHPRMVTRLAVLDIAPVAYAHDFAGYLAAMRAIPLHPGLTRQQAEAALASAVPEPPIRQFLLNNLILAANPPHWRLALPEIAAAMADIMAWTDPPGAAPYPGPALFLNGGNSTYVQPAADPAIARLFPHARRQTIAHAGHWLHAEQPLAVIAALTEFLLP